MAAAGIPPSSRRGHARSHHGNTNYRKSCLPSRCARRSKGNMWFSSHKTQTVGQLDPRTGIVKEYTDPADARAMPGTHAVKVDKNDTVWFSENWGHNLTSLIPNGKDYASAH